MNQLMGNLFIVAAPSGAGKSSLIKALLGGKQSLHPMQVSVSHTTRAPRPGEVNGEHYHFVSKTEFEQLIEQGNFFEWAEVFGNYYGTSKLSIEQQLKQGIDVFLDIDWQGARQVKQQIPAAVGVFIAPPSKQVLFERLTSRGQDTAEVIQQRMDKARGEISHYAEFDYILVNDDFNTALAELEAIVSSCRLTKALQSVRHQQLFAELLAAE